MREGEQERRPSKWFVMVLAATFVAALAGLLWSYSLAGRLTHAEAQLAATQKQNAQLATALNETNAKLQVTRQSLGHRLGATRRELRRRANDLLHRQQVTAKKLEQEQAEESAENPAESQAGATTGLPETQGQPAGTLAQMRKTQGDLGVESGLIATNDAELKVLEQAGKRDYYPFALEKGKTSAVGTVELELRRVNVKRKRYTLTVFADGKKIEKKNRTVDEPVQFYVGKERVLYELVVNQVMRDQVQGYLATPKGGGAGASTD